MIKTIQNFKNENFYDATKTFFAKLNIPLHEITTKAIDKNDLFVNLNSSFEHVQDIYAVGMITDEFFRNGKTEVDVNIKKDYDGVLIFAVELENETPTRKTLADISRTFNREYKYTPVIILFKYGNKLSLSNTQRQKYKINKDGEKATKVTILRDIDTTNPHTGHIKILNDMQLNAKVNSYEELYMYWQEVFNVSVLNKSFYKELSNWYFWTLQVNNVNFPNAPEDITISRQEHNAKNIIRLLTRLLFVWFIKEKGLIPDELFDEEYIKNNLLKEFEPKKAEGLFADSDRQSKYYKAVLQNLFFATLNQEMGKRAFRKDGQNRNITNLMRYENYFKNPNTFVELVEKVVPFMNGGLFECLDKPHPTQKGKQGGEVIVYEDGFSDRTDNELVVPDYIFFGFERHVDLSGEYGTKGKANNDTDIKGLITILKSYKFTVAENTPIEEDVALDPELLGKVFENLLASYNPETKTTARKQTGSFYTPREIVNYMVDESLIAYLKTKLEDYDNEEELDKKLHELLAFDMYNPFEDDKETVQKIIHVIDEVKILDPAAGSGAFPMGTLQKMVHLLTKLDPQNEYWKDLQLEKAKKETDEAFKMSNKSEISQKLTEINEAFDADINHPDYARKLYLIENCIFGVDIQPIAIQISKLRFFISLVVEQNVLNDKPNFGIRPLPNLESKFVCANTLIGIEKSEQALFDSQDIKDLEQKLKEIRHRVFNAKTPRTKRSLKEQDKELREKIADELVKNGLGNETAKQIASWDPYDQNESSPFFDMEWMFGILDGFDIVIGNPPYIKEYSNKKVFDIIRKNRNYYQGKMDIWYYFSCVSIDLLKDNGILSFIAQNNWITSFGASKMRNKVLNETRINSFIDFNDFMIFDSASIQTMIFVIQKNYYNDKYHTKYSKLLSTDITCQDLDAFLHKESDKKFEYFDSLIEKEKLQDKSIVFTNGTIDSILNRIESNKNFELDNNKEVAQGIVTPNDYVNKNSLEILGNEYKLNEGIFNLTTKEKDDLNFELKELELIKPLYTSKEIDRYYTAKDNVNWVVYTDSSFKDKSKIEQFSNLKKHLDRFTSIITSDNKPYGIHRARNEYFFKGSKILALRKCVGKPLFSYADFDTYVNQSFYVIKSERINLKYLTALLNSKLVAFWLNYKGKMQGDNYQIDKEPILNIPIKKVDDTKPFEIIVDYVIFLKSTSLQVDKYVENKYISQIFEDVLDAYIFELYFEDIFNENSLKFINYGKEYFKDIDGLDDSEKAGIISNSYQLLKEKDNQIRNNLQLMPVRVQTIATILKSI